MKNSFLNLIEVYAPCNVKKNYFNYFYVTINLTSTVIFGSIWCKSLGVLSKRLLILKYLELQILGIL